MRTAALCFCVLITAIAGCAPATVQGVRDDAAGKAEINAQIGYQEAYRRIITPARACFQAGGMLSPSFNVQGDIFTDTKKGEISFLISGFSNNHPAVIDIISTGEDSTLIRTYYWSSGWSDLGDKVARWVNEKYTGCDAKS